MFKRIMCLGLAISIAFSVCCRQVKAEEITEKTEETTETVDEMIENYDEEMAEIDEMYRNLEITLPEEEFVWEEEKKTIAVNSNARATISVPKGICTSGTATGTAIIQDMTNACAKTYVSESSGIKTSFSFGEQLKDSFVIPGMKNTNVKGFSCNAMIPQGITYHDGYYFVTAYCGEREHDSVIYVIDGSSKKYITTLVLVLDKDPHLGGITYANGYLWLCDTRQKTDTTPKESFVYYYTYSEIKEAILYAKNNSSVKSISLANYTYGCADITNHGSASFITTYNGYLCIGEYESDFYGKGNIRYYYPKPTSSGTLGYFAICEIPPLAQGIDFYVSINHTYIILTASWGYLDSTIYVYKKSGTSMSGTLHNRKIMKFPCKLEEVIINGNTTYFIFESCAKKYRLLSRPVIGAACGFNTNYILK